MDLLGIKAGVVLLGGKSDRIVFRIDGLDQYDPRQVAASGSPSRLRQKLERPLGSAEIRQAQADIGRHNSHQRDVWNVVTLGDRLRPKLTVHHGLAILMMLTSYESFRELPAAGLGERDLIKELQRSAKTLLLA